MHYPHVCTFSLFPENGRYFENSNLCGDMEWSLTDIAQYFQNIFIDLNLTLYSLYKKQKSCYKQLMYKKKLVLM